MYDLLKITHIPQLTLEGEIRAAFVSSKYDLCYTLTICVMGDMAVIFDFQMCTYQT